ncbi:MAG: transposase [Oscillospiraceae bacterium]|nr:transposase [Oscillospiraceae bacterium]
MDHTKRKEIRLKNYNYNSDGSYFVTFCVQDKKQILSSIHVGALHEAPTVELTVYGKAVKEVIKAVEKRFGVTIDEYVIMPNHVHIIITI